MGRFTCPGGVRNWIEEMVGRKPTYTKVCFGLCKTDVSAESKSVGMCKINDSVESKSVLYVFGNTYSFEN